MTAVLRGTEAGDAQRQVASGSIPYHPTRHPQRQRSPSTGSQGSDSPSSHSNLREGDYPTESTGGLEGSTRGAGNGTRTKAVKVKVKKPPKKKRAVSKRESESGNEGEMMAVDVDEEGELSFIASHQHHVDGLH